MERRLARLAASGLALLMALAVAAPTSAQDVPQYPLSVRFTGQDAVTPLNLTFVPAGFVPVTVTAPSLQQQTTRESDPGIGFGVSGGLTWADLTGDVGDLVSTRTGWSLGIWFGGNRDGTLGFAGELNYVTKAASEGEDDVTLHYLQIPAYFRVNAGSRSRNSVVAYGIFGGVADIFIKDEGSLNVVGDYNGFDLGFIVGGGVEITRVGFELRVDRGLKNIYDPADGATDIKTLTWQGLVKIRIN